VDVFLRPDGLSELLRTKYHTISDAVSALGAVAEVRQGFEKLQKELYAA